MQTEPSLEQSATSSASIPQQPESPGLVELKRQLLVLPLFRAAAARERQRLLELAERAPSTEEATRLLESSRALLYFASAKFESDVYHEVSEEFPTLDSKAIRRLLKVSAPDPLDKVPSGAGSLDYMPYDSDGGAVVQGLSLTPRKSEPSTEESD